MNVASAWLHDDRFFVFLYIGRVGETGTGEQGATGACGGVVHSPCSSGGAGEAGSARVRVESGIQRYLCLGGCGGGSRLEHVQSLRDLLATRLPTRGRPWLPLLSIWSNARDFPFPSSGKTSLCSREMMPSGIRDSLVVGEGQILSQVRQCHLYSIEENGHGGKVLSRKLNNDNAVAVGKRVRSESAISKGSVSISLAAVELSEVMCQPDLNLPFSEACLAVVGAGKMMRLLITHLASRGLERITVVNRSLGRPNELKEQFPDVDVEVILMDDLWDVVGRSDIVYTATSSTYYVFDEILLEENGLASG
eukprot:scaffold63769_cov32-Attheya_sp.AAC.5